MTARDLIGYSQWYSIRMLIMRCLF